MTTKKISYLSVILTALFALVFISCESTENRLIDRGIEHLALKEYKLAIDDFTDLLKENPNFNDAYFLRAYAYYESAINLTEIDLARKDFSSYIDNNQEPELKEIKDLNIGVSLGRAYIGRAIALSHINQLTAAFEDIDKAIELVPEYAATYNARGYIHANNQSSELAIADFQKAISLNRAYPEPYENLGFLYHKLGKSTNAQINIAVSYTHLTLPPNREV